LLYVSEAVVAGSRILETIYTIGWRGKCDEKVGRKTGRALRGPVVVDAGECKWSEVYDSDVVKPCEQGGVREEKGRNTRSESGVG